MSELRQAAQAALDALESDAIQRTFAGGVRMSNAAIALRAALAQPPAPTAPPCNRDRNSYCQCERKAMMCDGVGPAPTAQPVQQPADERITSACETIDQACDLMLEVISKPREPGWSYRNTITTNRQVIRELTADIRRLAAAQKPVQQPGAEADGRLHADGYFTWKRRDGYVLDAKLPCDFYLAAPAQRQPLPPFRVSEILIDAGYNFSTPEAIADFINGLRHGEAAHGITAAPAAQKGEKL